MARKVKIIIDIELSVNQYQQLIHSLGNDYIDNIPAHSRTIKQLQNKLKSPEVINGSFDPKGYEEAMAIITQHGRDWS